MIEIIKGTFGYFNGRAVVPITQADGPQSWDDELEKRLVARGVARYVDEKKPVAEPVTEDAEPVPEKAETRELKDLTVKELKELAKEMGIDTKKLKKKADLIEAIEGDDLPDFDPSDFVV